MRATLNTQHVYTWLRESTVNRKYWPRAIGSRDRPREDYDLFPGKINVNDRGTPGLYSKTIIGFI